jgi:hypothetical protein
MCYKRQFQAIARNNLNVLTCDDHSMDSFPVVADTMGSVNGEDRFRGSCELGDGCWIACKASTTIM